MKPIACIILSVALALAIAALSIVAEHRQDVLRKSVKHDTIQVKESASFLSR